MAWREIPASRKFRRSRSRESGAVIHTGERVYTGDVPDLLANAPAIGTEDFPYVTGIGVSSVDIETTEVSAAGIPQGRMLVYYEWLTPAANGRYRDGYRKDEFNVTTGSMSFSSDLTGKPITRYELITDGVHKGKYREVPATLEVTGGSGVLTIYMVTTQVGVKISDGSGNMRLSSSIPLKWARHIGYVNATTWMSGTRGQWKFLGARVGELDIPGQVVSSPVGWIQDSIPEVWFHFGYNSPGWNMDQFGTSIGQPVVVEPSATQPPSSQPDTQPAPRGKESVTKILNYKVCPYVDFKTLFPMIKDEVTIL